MADPTVLEIGEGNNITFDVKTVNITPSGKGETDFADVLGTAVGAAVTQGLFGGKEKGMTGFERGKKVGKDGERKVGLLGTAAENLLGDVGRSLREGFDEILKSINENITGGTFGGGPAQLTAGIPEARQDLRDLNLDPAKFKVDAGEVIKATKQLRELDGGFKSVLQRAKGNEEGIKKLATTFATLKTQFDEDSLLEIIKTQSLDANATVDGLTNKLLSFARRSGKFAQDNNIALRTAGTGISEFTEKLSFLGKEVAVTEATKLQQISRNLGLKGLPSIFTDALVTFDEAANFGADLGVLLGGINIDLNEFVNALPGERVEMGLGEIADAIDDGRLRIAEDGVKFGQQSALFAQQLGISRQEAERLLRVGREGGGEAIRTALDEGLEAGAALSPEKFAEDFAKQRTTEQVQETPLTAAGLQAAPGIAGVAENSIAILDKLNKNIEEQNIFNQLAPFVKAIQELTLIAKPFGAEKGAKGGIVRAGILAGIDPRDLISGFTEKTNEAGEEIEKTFNVLIDRLKKVSGKVGDIGNRLPGIPGMPGTPGGGAGAGGTGGTGSGLGAGIGGVDAATQAIANAFKDPKVVNAIAQSMRDAGKAAVNNTPLLPGGAR